MAIRTDLKESDTLVIAATGFADKLNLPVDKFFPAAGLESASKIIIIDTAKMFTLAGLQPEFQSFDDLVAYLRNIVISNKYKNIIVTGTSAGAHTALLLGYLLKADKVVAFAPYTYLSIKEAKKMEDPGLKSMSKVVAALDKLPPELKKYLDLHKILCKPNNVTEYYIHVSRFHKADYKRAQFLSGYPNVNIVSHPFKEHSIAAMLNKVSELDKCFVFPYERYNFLKKINLYLKFASNKHSRSRKKH